MAALSDWLPRRAFAYFDIDWIDQQRSLGIAGYCVLVGLEGGRSVSAGGQARSLSREALLVPACHGSLVVQPSDGLALVICAPGDISVTDCDARD